MTREVAHQKMFEAALAAIAEDFPPGKLPGDPTVAHTYYDDSTNGSTRKDPLGFELANTGDFGFELAANPLRTASKDGAL